MSADNPDSGLRRISVYSHRQAMDWSLVLASQGIESSIEADADHWQLVVADTCYERALSSIKQYRLENRGWRWRQTVPIAGSPVVFHFGSVFWCIAIIWIFFWSTRWTSSVEQVGMMNNKAVHAGEWWRIFTAITLHADVGHLSANVTTGFLLLGLAMARFGVGTALLAAYLAGAAGNLMGYAFYDEMHRGLGASGMVTGALGLLAFQQVARGAQWQARRIVLRGFGAAALLFILIGTSPGTDVLAHFGGFISGALFSFMLNRLSIHHKNSILDKSCAGLVIAFVLLTWTLALKTAR